MLVILLPKNAQGTSVHVQTDFMEWESGNAKRPCQPETQIGHDVAQKVMGHLFYHSICAISI